MKIISCLFAILVITYASSNMQFQFGNTLARLVNNQGYVSINCAGGSGPYSYNFSNLPLGWSAQGNNLIIPGITGLNGAYSFRARVTDAAGNVLNGIINLRINGIAVVIESGSGVFDNQVNFSITGNNNFGNLGGLGGFPGTGSGFPGSGSGLPGSGSGLPGSGSGLPGGISPENLYSSYPGLPSGTNVVPPSGSFPSVPSPSGPPSTPNPTPNVIRTIQATYVTERDTNPITVNEVKRTAIFNRQLNANKAVANLVAIIQQLTANVNAAQNDIVLLEQALKDAQLAYNSCNDQVFTLADTRARIQNAISDRQARLNDVNDKINKILTQIGDKTKILDQYIVKRTEAQQQASPNARKLAELEDQLARCESDRRRYESDLQGLNTQIADLKIKIQTTKDNAAAAPGEISRIDLQVPIVDRKILDLQNQLLQAQTERENLLSEKERFRQIIAQSSALVREYEAQITTLQRGIPGLQSKIDSQIVTCSSISAELERLRQLIGQNQQNFQIILQEITTQQTLITGLETEVNKLKDSIKGLPNELTVLTNELNRVEGSLRRQFYICNSAADEVRKAKQNLQAMSLKLQTESSWLQEANNNLERARAEKELADVAVEQIIATSTSSLPFSIVPNGNGLTNPGTPLGNNPSGSPLGSVAIRNQVDPNRQIVIGDISTYLSRAYEAGVDPSRPSTVSTIYPLSVATLETLVAKSSVGLVNANASYQYPSGGIYGFGCSAADNMYYGQGTVYSVQPGMIQVKNQAGNIQNLRVGGCSNLEATQQGHTLGLNDQVYYKGIQGNGGINLYSLTCLA